MPLLTGQFSLAIVVGMGVESALVSLMLALGYQPLPYRDPARLVAVWESLESRKGAIAISGQDFEEFAGATQNIFASLGAFTVPRVWLLDRKRAIRVRECYIEAGALSDLGIRPVLGRPVHQDEQPLVNSEGTSPAWISYRLWHSRYGGSSTVIGRTIGIADTAQGSGEVQARIVGVLPSGVSIPLPFENTTDVWCILSPSIVTRARRAEVFFGLGRLRPGVSAERAQVALTAVEERLGQRYSFDRGKRTVVQTLEQIAQGPARKTLGLLALGVGLVFLIGSVNLAILMGVEGRWRRREIAIRAAIGAGRFRLWGEVVAEKCLLTLVSLGMGVVSAFALLHVLVWLVPAAGLGPPLEHPPPLNLVALLAFVAFAIAAALVWSALLVAAADRQGSSGVLASAAGGLGYTGFRDSGPGSGGWRLVLLAGQAGVGICLLAAAALTAGRYATLSTANLGPAPRHTATLSYNTRNNVTLSNFQQQYFNQQVLSRLERLPGTQAIALADLFPPPGWPTSFAKQGDAPGRERDATAPVAVSPSYFRTLGIPILFGRGFSDADGSGSEPVAIISLDMAEANWATPQQAVGSQIYSSTVEESTQESGKNLTEKQQSKGEPKGQSGDHYEVVGVAGNFTGYWSQKPIPTIYVPEAQSEDCCSVVILRTKASMQTIATLAPQVLTGMATPATVSGLSTLYQSWQATLTRPLARLAGMLLLALLGLGLSVQGVYAVASGTVTARTHELGVRSALGAAPSRLAWYVTRELIFTVIVGASLGALASLDLRTLLEHWLGPVAGWQVLPVTVAVAVLVLAAAAGCYIPARAAARTSPAEVLREG